MEVLIYYFKLYIEGYNVFSGLIYIVVEVFKVSIFSESVFDLLILFFYVDNLIFFCRYDMFNSKFV